MTVRASRRRLLAAAVALPLARVAYAQPTCGALSASQTEGPFFKPKSPQRVSLLEKDAKGARIVVTGRVLSARCTPVAGALLDFWHADEAGDYDNQGFRYRGHQFADSEGRWRLESIVPAEYPGRARHFHVKVQAPGKRILTTQLYFPGEAGNQRDFLYREDLTLRRAERGHASFDFVVEA
jgi:protocatechuate 3,4-dioxygenase beta subunit